MAILSSAAPSTERPPFLEYVKSSWQGPQAAEDIQHILNALKKSGVTRVEWLTYYYSDENHTQDPEFYNDSGWVDLNYKDLQDTDPVTGKVTKYYSTMTLVDQLSNYAADHGSFSDFTGRFEFDLTTGELRRTSDAYMPDPEMVETPLPTPESFTFGDMSLFDPNAPITKLVNVEEWHDITGEARDAWDRWAEYAHHVYGERVSFMHVEWPDPDQERPTTVYAYDKDRSVMLFDFTTPFWADFAEDGRVDINRANKVAHMYGQTLPRVHGFANIKEMKLREIRVEQHTIDPSSGDTVAVVPSVGGHAGATGEGPDDNDEVPF